METRSVLRYIGLLVLLVGGGLGLVGCGADATATPAPTATAARAEPTATPAKAAWEIEWDKTVAAAEQEGKLVVTVFSATDRNAGQRFGEAFPRIQTEVQIVPGREFVARVPEEMKAGIFNFDIFQSGSTTGATQLVPLGNVIDDTRSNLFLPEVIDDKMWVGGDFGDYWADDTTKRYIPNPIAGAGGNSFRVNRQVAPDVQTVDDWLNPKYKGKVCLEDPRTFGGGDTFFTVMMVFRGEAFVRQILTETDPKITRDLRQLAADTVRGDCAITVGAGGFAEFDAQGVTDHIDELNAPFGEIAPDLRDKVKIICCGAGKNKADVEDDISGGAGGPALLRNAPHPNAAKLYLNWWLSKAGQEAWFAEQTTVKTDEGVRANNCNGRVDTQHLCAPHKRPDPNGAYIGFQWASNVELRNEARALAQSVLGR